MVGKMVNLRTSFAKNGTVTVLFLKYGYEFSLDRCSECASRKHFRNRLTDNTGQIICNLMLAMSDSVIANNLSRYVMNSTITCLEDAKKSVHVVQDSQTGFLRVLKKINLDFIKDLNEISSHILKIKQLKHPNLLCYLEAKVSSYYLHVITPFYAYGSCDQLLLKYFPFGFSETLVAIVVKGVLQALAYIHSMGFIHRGVRGKNIYLSANGIVCLSGMEFSCSMLENGKRKSKLYSFPNIFEENLNWLSPEILEQELCGYNEKSDIYSVGMTICELANGVAPFDKVPSTFMLLEKSKGFVPQLWDQKTFSLEYAADQFYDGNSNGDGSDSSEDVASKNEVYFKKKFSKNFHKFKDSCLIYDPNKRPSAKDLLNNIFLKNAMRQHIDFKTLISPALPIVEFAEN